MTVGIQENKSGKMLTHLRCERPVIECTDDQGPVSNGQIAGRLVHVQLLLWWEIWTSKHLEECLCTRGEGAAVKGIIHECKEKETEDGRDRPFQGGRLEHEEPSQAVIPLVEHALRDELHTYDLPSALYNVREERDTQANKLAHLICMWHNVDGHKRMAWAPRLGAPFGDPGFGSDGVEVIIVGEKRLRRQRELACRCRFGNDGHLAAVSRVRLGRQTLKSGRDGHRGRPQAGRGTYIPDPVTENEAHRHATEFVEPGLIGDAAVQLCDELFALDGVLQVADEVQLGMH